MSYSFTFRAPSKAEAKTRVAAELAKVAANHPINRIGQSEAEAATAAFIDLLPDDDSKDVYVSVSGSVGWIGEDVNVPVLTSASIHIGAALMVRYASAAMGEDEQPSV
jgi:hypothetical protein